MKKITFLLFFCLPFVVFGQNDTLLFENFEVDPEPNMKPFPEGNDTIWVNFDEDEAATLDPNVGKNWFQEYEINVPIGTNNVFTSISYFANSAIRNKNWLILPPIKIENDQASVHWKSAPFEGPAYMDGYFLLVSDGENFTENFVDTLFAAAECTAVPTGTTTTDPAFFSFSPGYIHANSYQDSAYFKFNGLTNFGKLEPHSYFLNAFAGKTIYLAFFHNSLDDNRLDLDDILVLGKKTLGASESAENGFDFDPILYPNPVQTRLNVLFSMKTNGFCRFSVIDEVGKLIYFEEKNDLKVGRQSWNFEASNMPSGVYFLKMENKNGTFSRRFLKK
jgi:Secretion system C-terminal sorting domain/Cleaved Adhesin Domain